MKRLADIAVLGTAFVVTTWIFYCLWHTPSDAEKLGMAIPWLVVGAWVYSVVKDGMSTNRLVRSVQTVVVFLSAPIGATGSCLLIFWRKANGR